MTNHKAPQLVCWVHPRGDCKEEPSSRCPGRVGSGTSAHPSTSPGLGYARLEGKPPGVTSPGGFWQLQHVTLEQSESIGFPKLRAVAPPGSDSVNAYWFPRPLRDRGLKGWVDISWWTPGTCINNCSAPLLEAYPLLGGHRDAGTVARQRSPAGLLRDGGKRGHPSYLPTSGRLDQCICPGSGEMQCTGIYRC